MKVGFEISSVVFSILHHIDRHHVKFEGPRWLGSASSGPDKMALTPLWLKKKMFGLGGSWYSNRPARTHGFNAKIGFEKYATSPEISAKKCQILLVWFGRPILDTFLVISWDSVHIFQNRFLRWNRESEPVDLNTMNPIFGTTFFFTYKGVCAIFRAISDTVPGLGFEFRLLRSFTQTQSHTFGT